MSRVEPNRLAYPMSIRIDLATTSCTLVYRGDPSSHSGQLLTTAVRTTGLADVLSPMDHTAPYGPSGATARDDRVERRTATRAQRQNLSTMPTSNVRSESVVDDSTPPNLTVGSNRDTEGRASGSTGRPTRPQDRPRPPVPTCAWSQQLVWFESSAHLPNTEEKGKFNEFMIHGSAYTAGVDGNMTLPDLRRVAFRLAQRSVRNFWLMLPS